MTVRRLMSITYDFKGQVALVTGAAGGIGAAIVKSLKAKGAKVAVADRDTSGIEADAHLPGDLLDGTYCDSLPEAVVAALGRLDIVVNNAGVITRGPVTETTTRLTLIEPSVTVVTVTAGEMS